MSIIVRDRSGWVTRWNSGPSRPANVERHILTALSEASSDGGGQVVLWVERVDPSLDACAMAAGFTSWRKLLQMRCSLPTRASKMITRSFNESDAAAVLHVNNRAFSWHPEQGGWTLDDFAQRVAEPWFDADGLRIYEASGQVRVPALAQSFHASQTTSQIAAFCWTKIHPANAASGDPELGEIYVAAVDPEFQRQGLGVELVLAGLQWLNRRGVATGMLYVEHDNVAALRTYERVGFEVHHVDQAYRRCV